MTDDLGKLKELEKEYGEVRTRLLDSAGLTAAQQEELAKVDKTLLDLRARKTKEERKASGGGALSLASATNDEDTAKAFDHLTPGERAHLYTENREEWQRGIDAQEREGTRRLLGTN